MRKRIALGIVLFFLGAALLATGLVMSLIPFETYSPFGIAIGGVVSLVSGIAIFAYIDRVENTYGEQGTWRQ